MNGRFNVSRAVRTGICGIGILVVLAVMFCAWPGYLIHRDYVSETWSDSCIETEPLAEGDKLYQFFQPDYPWLMSLQIAACFLPPDNEEAALRLELFDEAGEIFFETEIPLQDMESTRYYTVPIRRKLDTGQTWCWSVTPVNTGANEVTLLYTEITANQAPENRVVCSAEREYAGQTVSQYSYAVHLDKIHIICIWLGTFCLYIAFLEAVHRYYSSKS